MEGASVRIALDIERERRTDPGASGGQSSVAFADRPLRRLITTVETLNLTNHPYRMGEWPHPCRIVRYRTPSETGQLGSPLKEGGMLLNERRLDEFTSRDLIAAQPCFEAN